MQSEEPARVRLDSWKAIAARLGRSVRTVQRWELEEGLPVRRLQLQQRGSVFAWQDELDAWWQARSHRLNEQPAAPGEPALVHSEGGEAGRSRLRIWIAVAMPLLALLVAVLVVTRSGAPRPKVSHEFAIPLTTYQGAENNPTFSPDGSEFAFTWNPTPQNTDIYAKSVRGETPRRLTTHPGLDFGPEWSPDGKLIAFWRMLAWEGSELLLVSPQGGPERSLGEFHGPVTSNMKVPGPYHYWTPDSRNLVLGAAPAAGQPLRLSLLSLADGKRTALFDPPAGVLGDAGPVISPDGKRLVFHRFVGQGSSQIYVVPINEAYQVSDAPKAVTFDRQFNAAPVWINSREIVFYGYRFGEMQLLRMNVDEPGQVIAVPGGSTGLSPAYSAAARQLAFVLSRPNSDLWRAGLTAPGTAAGGDGREFVPSTRQEAVPAFSPDGRSLAFTSARAGYPNTWICETTSPDHCRQITRFQSSLTGPASWSPDGRQLVLASNQSGSFDIYVVPAAGGDPKVLVNSPVDDSFPFWSRDGRWIYFASNRTGRFEVWKVPAEGGAPTQVTAHGGYLSAESPDGRWLYYSEDSNGVTSLWRRSLAGDQKDMRVIEKFWQWYAPGRSGVYFNPVQGRQVWYWDAASGATRPVADLPYRLFMGVAISPNERELCVTVFKPTGQDIMMFENFR